jgi:uncharacterized membrane protein
MFCKNCGQENLEGARYCIKCGMLLDAPMPTAAAAVAFEPGVGSSYGNGWKQLWPHFLELFLILIIGWVISGLGGFLLNLLVIFLSPLFSVFVGMPLQYGISFAYLRAARGEKVEIADMFTGFKTYWNAIGASILTALIVIIGLIFLIIPGIYFACKLAFVPYLVVDRKMGCIKAIEESWRMTGGYGWKVFLIGLLAIPIFIAGLICLGVGVIISGMWVSSAFASLYYAVSMVNPPRAEMAPVAPPAPAA